MTEDPSRLRRVKEAAEADLMKRPGVTGVDIGYKYVAGQRTEEIVIRVHVQRKNKDVPTHSRIPAEIDGIKTDVIETNPVLIADDSRYDPLRGGIAIGPARPFADKDFIKVGTLGAFVFDNSDGSLLMLSNYHVMCVNDDWNRDNFTKSINQPFTLKGNTVAYITKGFSDERGDCAVAKVDLEKRSAIYDIVGIGAPQGIADAAVNDLVRKRGRTTELTRGRVDGLTGTISIPGTGKTFKNVVTIVATPSAFCDRGDSGSIVVNEQNEAVGLLTAKDENTGNGFAIPIRQVLKNLDVSMAITIGGYDLASSSDRALAFDFGTTSRAGSAPNANRNTCLDHLVFFRPGAGAFCVLRHDWASTEGGPVTVNRFRPVYFQGDPGQGIGGWDLANSSDQGFAFDYNGNGRLDHLVFYRPGKRAICILRNDSEDGIIKFTPVYFQGDPGQGIGGWDLANSSDQGFAFDYNGNGRLDHLVFYRPGKGGICILGNGNKDHYGYFKRIYFQGDPGGGIGGWDLGNSADRMFAFDFAKKGLLDHLVIYRPGKRAICILRNDSRGENIRFTPIYFQGDDGKGKGLGGWDLASGNDQAFAFDYEGNGRLDHIVFYRPGKGAIFILKNDSNDTDVKFTPVYKEGDPGHGIGGFDLLIERDRMFPYDYEKKGLLNHLVVYRPGERVLFILRNDKGKFKPVFKTSAPSTWPNYS
jgi:S1-C subfamily serine protease